MSPRLDQILPIRRVGDKLHVLCHCAMASLRASLFGRLYGMAIVILIFNYTPAQKLRNCFPRTCLPFPFAFPVAFPTGFPVPFRLLCWLITCGYFDFNLLVSRSSVAVAVAAAAATVAVAVASCCFYFIHKCFVGRLTMP